MAYKYGRIERDTARYAPTLEDYLRVHPASGMNGLEAVAGSEDVDRITRVTEIPMYCNGPDPGNPAASPDGIGDCTDAEMAHGYTALDVYSGKPQALFPDSSIVTAYSAVSGYNPLTGANDNGCQMQDVLKYNHDVGMTDVNGNTHKVLMYAALGNPADPMMLSRVLKTFGWVYIGINAPQSAQQQFGQVWTYVAGSPVEGGHCVGLHRRQPYGSREGVFDMVTWGAVQPATLGFIGHYVTEAWAVITPDWLEANGSSCDGIALSQLESDMAYV